MVLILLINLTTFVSTGRFQVVGPTNRMTKDLHIEGDKQEVGIVGVERFVSEVVALYVLAASQFATPVAYLLTAVVTQLAPHTMEDSTTYRPLPPQMPRSAQRCRLSSNPRDPRPRETSRCEPWIAHLGIGSRSQTCSPIKFVSSIH